MAGIVKENKTIYQDIHSAVVVARPVDKNFNINLYDEIIQRYLLYHDELDCDESFEAYDRRDMFLAHNIDIVF